MASKEKIYGYANSEGSHYSGQLDPITLLPDGFGIVSYGNGSKHIGEWKNGNSNGYGEFTITHDEYETKQMFGWEFVDESIGYKNSEYGKIEEYENKKFKNGRIGRFSTDGSFVLQGETPEDKTLAENIVKLVVSAVEKARYAAEEAEKAETNKSLGSTPPSNDPPPPPSNDPPPPSNPDDDTCAGIENLCFLSNTISRLKFDCVSSLQIMGALNLAHINLNDMSYLEYRTAIDSVPNYENIMDDEDELVQQIAYENSKNTGGDVEGDATFDPVTGNSPNTIAARNTEIYGGYCLQADLIPLLQFTETVRNDAKIDCKLYKILKDMSTIMKCAFGIPEDEFNMKQPIKNIRLYDNIDLVELDTKSLFPKFSFNILTVKSDMLLQTRLLAGRENGMGFFLNDYVGSVLQPYFDSIITGGFGKVKIIPPSDTGHLWQIKLRVLKTDFIFISIQIINVKQEYFVTVGRGDFMVDQIYNTVSTLATTYAVGADVMADDPETIERRIREDYIKSLNLCFSLYNKCLSKDFNALCSLSELDGIVAKMFIMNDPKSCEIFTIYITYFLDNLVDTYINVKRQYFYLGLYNLLVSISQKKYTPETKAYEKLFDPNSGKNIFFDSMHVIKTAVNNANTACPPNSSSGTMGVPESVQTKMSEPIQFAMGGGKLYSLYQKALNNFDRSNIFMPSLYTIISTTADYSAISIVKTLHDFQNTPFIQQYLQSRDKQNIHLREKINQLFLLKIQQKQQEELIKSLGVITDNSEGLNFANEILSEMITTLGGELNKENIILELIRIEPITISIPLDIEKVTEDDFKSIFDLILKLSTVLPVIDDIYDNSYEYAVNTFLHLFIPNQNMNTIKYLLTNFESIRCRYNNNLVHKYISESVNPAADADFSMFYEDTALGATSCMTVCMILQLALTDLINVNVINLSPANEPWNGSEIDIGNSCIGTPPVTLSSLRIVINNSVPFYNDILPETGSPYPACITSILSGANLTNVKSTISPFDFVQKGSLIAYIKHILEAVNTFGALSISKDNISNVAKILSIYCMITDECCSTPLKGIFDIFYTLFIIENFANRALVTQKINKELKRIAICAKVLFLHYNELYSSKPHAEIKNMLDILLEMCSFSFSEVPFSLNNESQMIYIMNKYVEFVNMIANFALQSPPEYLFFCRFPSVKPREFTFMESTFYHLLRNSAEPATKVEPTASQPTTYFISPNSEVASNFTNCIPCVLDILDVLNKSDPSILQMLNNNKQYCAECDAMNKASGRIILSSAYQSVLWSTKKYKTISKTRPHRDVSGLYDLLFRNRDIRNERNKVFNEFIKSFISSIKDNCKIDYIGNDGNPANTPITTGILKLGVIVGIVVEQPDVTPKTLTRTLQFLFWFLTSVFGVKTKSKSTKIQGLTRKYLSLIMESIPNPLVTTEQLNIIPDLFGYKVTITNLESPTAPPSPSTSSSLSSASCRGMDKSKIPLYYLRLAYDEFIAPMAYNKYTDYAEKHPKTDVYPAGVNRSGFLCDVVLYDGGIALDPYTPVMDFILPDLSGRFEKLPSGISKIIAVSEKMRSVLLNFLEVCKDPPSVQKYICSLSEDSFADILYIPGMHDVKKFLNLTSKERMGWLRYLILKINSDTTKFFYIKLLFLLIKYLIMPDISAGTLCVDIFTALPQITFNADILGALQKEINNYYDKCGQIERQQKVTALNADRKGITLTDVCVLPKTSGKPKKDSKLDIGTDIAAAIDKAKKEQDAAIDKAKKEQDATTSKLNPIPPPTKADKGKIDTAIKTEAAASVVSKLLQNLVSKPTKTKKSTNKGQEQGDVVITASSPPPSAPARKRKAALDEPPTAAASTFGAPTFGAPTAAASTFGAPTFGASAAPFASASSSDEVLFKAFNQLPQDLERQNKPLSCGRHALNNLLRGSFFTFDTNGVNPSLSLDQIQRPPPSINLQQVCYSMVKQFPTLFTEGTGECPSNEFYDINLLRGALSLVGYNMNINPLQPEEIKNLNNPDTSKYIYLLINIGNGGHWVAVRKYIRDPLFYLYDSMQKTVLTFNSIEELTISFKSAYQIYSVTVADESFNLSEILKKTVESTQLPAFQYQLGQPLLLTDGTSVRYVDRRSSVNLINGEEVIEVSHYTVATEILENDESNSDTFKCVYAAVAIKSEQIISEMFISQFETCPMPLSNGIQIYLFAEGSAIPQMGNYISSSKVPFILCRGLTTKPITDFQLQAHGQPAPGFGAAASAASSSLLFGAPAQPVPFGAPSPFVTSAQFGAPSPFVTSAQFGAPPPFVTSALPQAPFGSSPVSQALVAAKRESHEVKDVRILDANNDLIGIFTGQAYSIRESTYPLMGQMVYYDKDGRPSQKYVGNFDDEAQKNGQGITTYYNDPKGRQSYEGTYENGLQIQGVITYTDGRTEQISPQIQPSTLGNQPNRKKRERDDSMGSKQGSTDAALNTELRGYKKAVRRIHGGGGSPTISIPTPSKTHKLHQGKRTHSSNKSTFKRRKYTEE